MLKAKPVSTLPSPVIEAELTWTPPRNVTALPVRLKVVTTLCQLPLLIELPAPVAPRLLALSLRVHCQPPALYDGAIVKPKPLAEPVTSHRKGKSPGNSPAGIFTQYETEKSTAEPNCRSAGVPSVR